MYTTDQDEDIFAETVVFPGANGQFINAYLARPLGVGLFPGMVLTRQRQAGLLNNLRVFPKAGWVTRLFSLAGLLALFGLLFACAPPRPTPDPNYFLTATEVPPITPAPTPTLTGDLAQILIGLDMGSGGAGFAATIYAQEVETGKTFKTFLPAGMHGQAVLPTSPPLLMSVQAPGTYVFYARLINAPDDYFYGYTRCRPNETCPDHALLAVDVLPNRQYQITISDKGVLLPEIDQPVRVPWVRE